MGAAFFRSAKESMIWFWIYLGISAGLLSWEVWDATTTTATGGDATGSDSSSSWSSHATYGAEVYAPSSTTHLSSPSSSHSSSEKIIQQVYFLMNIMGCMGVIYSAVFLFARELEREYTKSEEVLLNILPSKIVKRIKRGEFPIVDHVANVTILFADLVGFTKASAELHPNFLVGLFLRDIFHAFDELVYKHGLEKIKTIGDAYMVVGGLDHSDGEEENKRRRRSRRESRNSDLDDGHDDDHHQGDCLPSRYDGIDVDGGDHHHPTSIMLLALDMFHELARINKKYNLNFSLRVGVHKGPVVAGVLGLKRFTYDVWGDSVNVSMYILTCLIVSYIQCDKSSHNASITLLHLHFLLLTYLRLQAEWNQMECQT
jgi:class 3 adenylate cyclase